MKKANPKKARNWVFTLNNPQDKILPPENCKLLLYSPEVGSSGTPHFQGYIELTQARALSYLKAWLPQAHFEVRKGTQYQAVTYCLKNFIKCETDEISDRNSSISSQQTESQHTGLITQDIEVCGLRKPSIYGFAGSWEDFLASITPKKKETVRERLEKIKNELITGNTEEAIANMDFELWVKYHKSFSSYKALIQPKRNHEMSLIILVGPTGCGKSKYCLDNYPTAYWKQRSQWWDGYENHDTVIIDEFYGWLPYDLLLRLADRYPMQVEVKGGQVNFTANTICITSNIPPKHWYKNIKNLSALYRRVTSWVVFDKNHNATTTDTYPTILEHYEF